MVDGQRTLIATVSDYLSGAEDGWDEARLITPTSDDGAPRGAGDAR